MSSKKLPIVSNASLTKEQFIELFSVAMRNRRKEIGMTQVDLAKKLETKQSAVSRWEKGHDSPGAMMFLRIMMVLQFDPFGLGNTKRKRK